MLRAGRGAALLALCTHCSPSTVRAPEPHGAAPREAAAPVTEPHLSQPRVAEPHVTELSVPEPVRLAFVSDFNPPRRPEQDPPQPGASWDGAMGGLSGLYYSERDASLYAVSDYSDRFPPRLYRFAVELTDTTLRITPREVIVLHERTPTGLLTDLDAESLTFDRSGAFFVGTENADSHPTQRWPSILRIARDGLITGKLRLPAAYLPELTGVPTRGPRTNLAFEGLSASPSGRYLTAITETALRQDGPLATFEHGTTSRLLRWDLDAPDAPPAEYRYETEPVARPRSGEARDLSQGVSELVSLDDQRQLLLERTYVSLAVGHGVNFIRIFEASIPEPAPARPPTDSPALFPLLEKRLVLDLDDVVGQFEAGQRSLDNFEGMALGPRFASGEQSLLLVTDDNFSSTQRTVFVALRIQADAHTRSAAADSGRCASEPLPTGTRPTGAGPTGARLTGAAALPCDRP
jgi:hypothetical protein